VKKSKISGNDEGGNESGYFKQPRYIAIEKPLLYKNPYSSIDFKKCYP